MTSLPHSSSRTLITQRSRPEPAGHLPVRLRPLVGLVLVAGFMTIGARWASADDTSADEQAIHAAAIAFVEAYNGKDAAAIAALFGPEARIEEADGTLVEGREAIAAAFTEVFAADPKAAISVTMDSIRLITPDVAVEQGATENFPDGETLTSRSRYMVVHLKKDGKWHMASVRTMSSEVLSNYEHLRPLEWLVGEWVDEGAESTVKTSCTWSENRSYLVQEFEVHELGGVSLKGTRRIGWDPQTKQIRSWIFDDSGAFGEASWTPVDGEWVVKVTGVSVDGETASATRRLQPQGGDHIAVTTTDRLFGNESLPDAAILMARQPAPPATADSAP